VNAHARAVAPAPAGAFADPAPGWLYDGCVMHARMKPFGHRFAYRVWSLFVDLDRVGEAMAATRVSRHNRFALVSFHDRDYGIGSAPTPRARLDALLDASGVARPARVFLSCYPRVLGHAFNPIAVYYCYDAPGRLSTLVYEVRNTFGERHVYVAPVAPGEASPAGIRQERTKQFFVSPFLGFGLTYRFRLNDPGDTMTLRILECDADGPVLAASFAGRRRPLDTKTLLQVSAAVPFLGLKVVAGIHFEAVRLWLKGARLFPRPTAPPPASLSGPVRFVDPDRGRRT